MMNRNMTTRLAGLLCVATLLATPPALRAQSADSTKAATMVVPAASPTGIDIQMSDIVAAPSNEELKQTKDEAKRLEESSATDLSAAKEREARYRSKADIRKSEIDATKSRIELAKKDKNKEAQSTLEATKKRQELEQQLYQKMAEMEKTKGQAADAALTVRPRAPEQLRHPGRPEREVLPAPSRSAAARRKSWCRWSARCARPRRRRWRC